MREALQRGSVRCSFWQVFERTEQEQIANDAGGQREGCRALSQPLADQKIDDCGRKQNEGEPWSPSEVEGVACDQESGLASSMSRNPGVDGHAREEQQTIQSGLEQSCVLSF